MKSNDMRGRSQEPLPSRSQVGACPTGRVIQGEPASQDLPISFKLLAHPRPAQGKFVSPCAGVVFVSLEMDFSSIERRLLAANPHAADYLKP